MTSTLSLPAVKIGSVSEILKAFASSKILQYVPHRSIAETKEITHPKLLTQVSAHTDAHSPTSIINISAPLYCNYCHFCYAFYY